MQRSAREIKGVEKAIALLTYAPTHGVNAANLFVSLAAALAVNHPGIAGKILDDLQAKIAKLPPVQPPAGARVIGGPKDTNASPPQP